MTQSGDNTSAYLVFAVAIETMGAHVMQHTVNPFAANSFFCSCVAVGIVGRVGIVIALTVAIVDCFCIRSLFCSRIGSLPFHAVHFIGIANAADNLLHGIDINCSHTTFLQVPQMFCHTMLYVVEYLVATIALGKIAAHVVKIVLKKCASVLVDGVERTKEVYVDVLLHN